MRRIEKDVFDDLSKLCTSPGYAHVIAYIFLEDNVISYYKDLTSQDIQYQYSYMERLTHTELSTLTGLMCKNKIDITLPVEDILLDMYKKTKILLKELQYSSIEDDTISPLKEAIFYGGESGYDFQFFELAVKKYQRENQWLFSHKGFSIEDAKTVFLCIKKIQDNRLQGLAKNQEKKELIYSKFLSIFILSIQEVVDETALSDSIVKKVFESFSLSPEISNQDFNSPADFNAINAFPLIYFGNDEYLALQAYNLGSALYETPFYWIGEDKNYSKIAFENRGKFTEEFSTARLKHIFGENKVFQDVVIQQGKNRKSDIDVLVIFSNIAIVLQAKSKRLTIKAKKGEYDSLQADFKRSIQDAYNQAVLCADCLLNPSKYKFFDAGNKIDIKEKPTKIYLLCTISDHYPALSMQSSLFLNHKQLDSVAAPLVWDIFTLDTVTEILPSPLYFLDYLNKRTKYWNRVYASHELSIFAYYLKENLCIEENLNLMIDQDVGADLDVSMRVRREGISGSPIPEGILTQFKNTVIGSAIEQIENSDAQEAVELGLAILLLNNKINPTLSQAIKAIEEATNQTKNDKKTHDVSIVIKSHKLGLTIHTHNEETFTKEAKQNLIKHCEKRKYTQKAQKWLGICLDVRSLSIEHIIMLVNPWERSTEMELLVKDLPAWTNSSTFSKTLPLKHSKKIGRNQLCPCGSKVKFKKCCSLNEA